MAGEEAVKITEFEQVFTFRHLWDSYKKCRKGVGWKPSIQIFNQNMGMNIYKLYKELHSGTFKSDGFYEFTIKERGKERHIRSVNIRERIVQRCLCDYCLVPALSKSLI